MANQINRQSLTTALVDRYAASDKATLPKMVNFMDQSNTFSKNFTEKQPAMTTEFTDKALNYSDSMGVNRVKYKG